MWEQVIAPFLQATLDTTLTIMQNRMPEEQLFKIEGYLKNIPWEEGLQKYKQFLQDDRLAIHFFGVSPHRVPINRFYIKTRVCPARKSRYIQHNQCISPKSGENLLALMGRRKRFYILGGAGAGKTSFLKFLAWEVLQQTNSEKARIPFFIPLHELSDYLFAQERDDYYDDIIKFRTFLFQIFGSFLLTRAVERGIEDIISLFIEHLLRSGRAILFLDGLDEIAAEKQRHQIRQLILQLSRQYPYIVLVVSSRIPPVPLPNFDPYLVMPFDLAQITQYARAWFHFFSHNEGHSYVRRRERANQFLQEIQRRRSFRDLASMPLLLNLLCLTFDTYSELVGKRVELYKQASAALLSLWRIVRGLTPPSDWEGKALPRSFKESFFQEVAYHALKKYGQRDIPANFILDILQKKLQAYQIQANAEELLENIERNYGILLQITSNKYTFLHPTFREYYAAAYIHARGNTLWPDLFERLGRSSAWNEVFLNLIQILDYPENVEELYNSFISLWDEERGDIIRQIQRHFQRCQLTLFETLVAWRDFLQIEMQQLAHLSLKEGLLPEQENETSFSIMELRQDFLSNAKEWLDMGSGLFEMLIETFSEHYKQDLSKTPKSEECIENFRNFLRKIEWLQSKDATVNLKDLEAFIIKIPPLVEGLIYAPLTPKRREAFLKTLLIGG